MVDWRGLSRQVTLFGCGYSGDEMNKIVREHYPVDKLPEDLRQGLTAGQTVTITVEEENAPSLDDLEKMAENILANPQPMSLRELRRMVGPSNVTSQEAVARIRALRDEWDD